MRLAKTAAISRLWSWTRTLTRTATGPALLSSALAACGSADIQNPPAGPMLAPCSAAVPGGVIVDGGGSGQLCLARYPEDKAAPAGSLSDAGASLALDGFMALGPAVTLRLQQPVGWRGIDVTLPIKTWPQALDTPAQRARLVILSRFGHGAVHVTPVENITVAAPTTPGGPALLRFHLPGHGVAPLGPAGTLADVAVFQVAAPGQLGQTVKRRYTYRAIAGVSMGGIGASMNFFRHPDRYDAVGVMGADPGPDLTYSQGFIRDYFFGGFCPQDGSNPSCPPQRAALDGQGEVTGSFDAMPIQQGEGIGLTLKRSLYLRANRDLVRALGNWAYYNPKNPYLPPGVPDSSLGQTPDTACQNPTVLPGKMRDASAKPFYDVRYNPAGLYDVITFCDGGEVDGKPGVYDDTKTQRDPAQILLAVDVNGNGRRDKGEPVIIQQSEPFRDVGLDGKANKDEPGYDPVTNPDPSGDDYHYMKNPGGTEGNWRYDAGEPYDDNGLDGVKGGCEIDSGTTGCFDHGEGNGKFDLNPGLKSWLDHDPHTLAESASDSVLRQRDIYYDAGIRDFFNAQVSTSTLFGVLANRGLPMRLFGGFPAMTGLSPSDEGSYDASSAPIGEFGSTIFVRYGDPALSDAMAAASGDGRHAGSTAEVVQRAVTLFSFLLSRWPDADRSLQSADDPRLIPPAQMFTLSNGRATPYSIILPPGYFDDANKAVRYPVAYFGHGYGMAPEDLGKSIGSLIHGFMSDPDETKRLSKAVLVFVDAVCRPGGEVPNAPLPTDGDLCEEGGFYTDHPTGTYLGETMLDQLDTYLRGKYRLRDPDEIAVPF